MLRNGRALSKAICGREKFEIRYQKFEMREFGLRPVEMDSAATRAESAQSAKCFGFLISNFEFSLPLFPL
jgi:hypothetical protein